MNLDGTWENQLGSNVTLATNPDGSLTGTYMTAVSSKKSSLPPTPISGTWRKTPDGVLFGFSAQWKFEKDGKDKYSTTSWSGMGKDTDSEKLTTTWILTSNVPEGEEWSSVMTNKDYFRKIN